MFNEKPKDGRYGTWAGNPKGNAEDKRYCVAQIMPYERGAISRQCGNRRGFGPQKEWCKLHDPKRVAQRHQAEKEASAQREAEQKALLEAAEQRCKVIGGTPQFGRGFAWTGGVDLRPAEAEALMLAVTSLTDVLPLAEAYLAKAPSSPDHAKLEEARLALRAVRDAVAQRQELLFALEGAEDVKRGEGSPQL